MTSQLEFISGHEGLSLCVIQPSVTLRCVSYLAISLQHLCPLRDTPVLHFSESRWWLLVFHAPLGQAAFPPLSELDVFQLTLPKSEAGGGCKASLILGREDPRHVGVGLHLARVAKYLRKQHKRGRIYFGSWL